MQLLQPRASSLFLPAISITNQAAVAAAAGAVAGCIAGALLLRTFPAAWVDGRLQVTCSGQQITMP
jgi:hypothetical protein